ncbi:hypothetical protein BOTNAR_0028g00340 [Botryotinia narcissicola]|uniref:Uncharacterized protein n=1 Tax=Botryotinia narcissicola TaxID=278944 RepID=A0A4Z1J3P7_9HELO|nr:hypothetical protein BOTNAR_0028g00340 [Botryotinia narcissicola]
MQEICVQSGGGDERGGDEDAGYQAEDGENGGEDYGEEIWGGVRVIGWRGKGGGNENGGGTANHVLWLRDTDCGDSNATFGHAVCGADVGEDDCTAAAHCPEEGLDGL